MHRIIVGKEDRCRILERFGIPSSTPVVDIIWLHAASIGESLVAVTLIEEISNTINDDINFLLTTGTTSSSKILKAKLKSNTIHQFLPIDNIIFVQKFLKKWKPKIGIFVESELWPAIICEAAKTRPMILVNARLSDRSYKRWLKLNYFFKIIISKFSIILTQSEIDAKKFKTLGALNVQNLGNIKFANKPLEFDPNEYQMLAKLLKDKKIVFFASTHKEDEDIILQIIKPLKEALSNVYFILAPRHPHRAEEVMNNCKALSLSSSLRTLDSVDLIKDLYIANSFGEIGLFYKLADIAYVGGSFGQGGHNPIEPLHFEKIIIFGPDMSNFREISEKMVGCQAARQIQDSSELYEQLKYFLDDKNKQESEKFKKACKIFVSNNRHVLKDYVKTISKYILGDF